MRATIAEQIAAGADARKMCPIPTSKLVAEFYWPENSRVLSDKREARQYSDGSVLVIIGDERDNLMQAFPSIVALGG